MDMLRRLMIVGWCLALLPSMTGCSVIDEDQSDCAPAPQAQLDYELRLVTNMTTELRTELTTQTDIELANALRQHLSDVFTDYAHDVDLSFYDTQGDSILLQKDEHIMDANQASYTLNLPMRQYMHLATANILDNELVTLENDQNCHSTRLYQLIRDTIDSHTTGIFTARQPMEVLGNVSQNFNVHLYMANCAAALVIDPRGHGQLDKIRVYSTGFATSFNICDSVYRYDARPPMVRTNLVATEDLGRLAFCSVTFPSKEPKQTSTRTIIETDEPFIAQPGDPLWEFHVYVAQPDGSITKTVLSVKTPLRAGQLKIIKCWISDDGEIIVGPEEPTPGPDPGPDPGHDPDPGPDPGPSPDPDPTPSPDPAPGPAPGPDPKPEPEPEPEPEPDAVSSEVSTSVTFNWKDGLDIIVSH